MLRNTKMIAEAWDCDGLNQVGGQERTAREGGKRGKRKGGRPGQSRGHHTSSLHLPLNPPSPPTSPQVGAFPHYGGRWAEWNGRFRDVVRNFIKGTDGNWAGDFASVMCGSPNVYAEKEAGENDW